jgi:hypothetical protein
MNRWWYTPALPVGLAVLSLGIGNWVISHGKIVEYTQHADAGNTIIASPSLDDFPALSPRTNATLLERLHRRGSDYTDVDAKIEFYTVAESGGRALTFIGLVSITLAVLRGIGRSRRRPTPASLP